MNISTKQLPHLMLRERFKRGWVKRLEKPEDHGICCEMSSLSNVRITPMKSHQHDFPNISWQWQQQAYQSGWWKAHSGHGMPNQVLWRAQVLLTAELLLWAMARKGLMKHPLLAEEHATVADGCWERVSFPLGMLWLVHYPCSGWSTHTHVHDWTQW